jgi:hypothetical protein
MSRAFLASFRPICSTRHGRAAVEAFDIPPFADGSCRREPDLEHEMPGISALCRASRFAPRLEVGDRVGFVTKRGRYVDDEDEGWKLVALLRVAHRFLSHREAATWYRREGLRLPGNCVVPENPPLPLERTLGPSGYRGCSDSEVIEEWDAIYQERAKAHPVFLVCTPLMVELHAPATIRTADWMQWCGKVPGTQNPPVISEALWDRLSGLTPARGRREAA